MDIVERLTTTSRADDDAYEVMGDARLEIQRLRDEVAALKQTLAMSVQRHLYEMVCADYEEQARLLGMSAERELKLHAKVDALRRDAERYRWLRNWFDNGLPIDDSFTSAVRQSRSIEQFDAAIDAATKGEV